MPNGDSMHGSALLAVIFVAASVASAFAALLLAAATSWFWQGRKPSTSALSGVAEPTVYLFEGPDLVDATGPAFALLSRLSGPEGEWDRLLSYLCPRLPGLRDQLACLMDLGHFTLSAPDDSGFSLHAELAGAGIRLTLTDLSAEGQYVVIDGLSHHAAEQEIAASREALELLPVAAWRCGADGSVIWANAAYMALATRQSGESDLVWPLPDLFGLEADRLLPRGPKRQRLLNPTDGKDEWFDCHILPGATGSIGFALPADNAVRAERSLRDFIQTLTKTFAHLPIGLAIFDRNRQLALFNPALTDLTTLDGEFLSGRPALFSFLDRLREVRILPEPKDYAGWRQQMIDLEKAASAGQYEETWLLPTGQTYRVTGRPHPEGAVAFLIEDISAEVSLTRRFRAEIELAQSVVDALEEAVAVFSETGELVMSNQAYATLWQVDPRPTLGASSILDAMRHWHALSHPTPVWGELRDFIAQPGERSAWEGSATLHDGRHIDCEITPMPRAATLVRFVPHRSERLQVRHSRKARQPAHAQ